MIYFTFIDFVFFKSVLLWNIFLILEIMISGAKKCLDIGLKQFSVTLTTNSSYIRFDRSTPSEVLRRKNKKIDADYPNLTEAERYRMKYKNMNEIATSKSHMLLVSSTSFVS